MEHQPWIEIPSMDGRKDRPGIDRVIQTRRHRCLFWIKGAILVRLLPDALADFGLDPAKLPSPFAAHVERDELRLLKADFLRDHILTLTTNPSAQVAISRRSVFPLGYRHCRNC